MKLATRAAALILFATFAAGAAEPVEEEMETVLVTGMQPGPGFWKVSHGDHVMWVFGNIGAVPESLEWRTDELEARIAESQEVLYPGWPNVGMKIGGFQALTLVRAAFKAARNPDGAMLKDVMSAESYATWQRLKLQYLGKDDDIEKYRPIVAYEKLNNAMGKKAMKGLKLTPVEPVIDKAARKHKVRINRLPWVEHEIKIEKPREILKAARDVDLAEAECVGRNLAKLEQAIESGRMSFDMVAVNAWATGDLDALRARYAADRDLSREDCETAAMMALLNDPDANLPAGMSRGLDLVKQQQELQALAEKEAESNWLQAVDAALASNRSTVAILPIGLAMNEYVYLAKLQARGYVVEKPRGLSSTNENAGP